MGDHSKQHIKIKDDIKELQAQNRQLRNELTQKPSPLIDNSVREWKCHAGGINCSSGETPLLKNKANHSYSNMYLNNSYYQIIQLSSYRLKQIIQLSSYRLKTLLHFIKPTHSAISYFTSTNLPLRAVKNSGERDGGDPECPSVQEKILEATPLKSGGQGGVQGLQHLLTQAKKLCNVGQGGGKA